MRISYMACLGAPASTRHAHTVLLLFLFVTLTSLLVSCMLASMMLTRIFAHTHLPLLALQYLQAAQREIYVRQKRVSMQAQEVGTAVEQCCALHSYACEHGLEPLARFCAAFTAVNIRAARACAAYRQLGPKELDEARF